MSQPHPPDTRGRDPSPKPLASSTSLKSASLPPVTPVLSDDGPKRTFPHESQPSPSPASPMAEKIAESTPIDCDAAELTEGVASMRLAEEAAGAPKAEGFTVKVVDRTTWVPKNVPPGVAESVNPPAKSTPVVVEASDALQISAAEYPWLYMSNTLDACFENPEPSKETKDSSTTPARDDEQTKEATPRVQFDETKTDEFSKTAPGIMKAFHAHGETYSRVEAEAMKLAMSSPTPSEDQDEDEILQVYRDMLQTLDDLHAEALTLESSLVELTSPPDTQAVDGKGPEDAAEPTAHSQILGVFNSSLSVVRARIANLSMAQELIDSALENLTIGFRMESLGIE